MFSRIPCQLIVNAVWTRLAHCPRCEWLTYTARVSRAQTMLDLVAWWHGEASIGILTCKRLQKHKALCNAPQQFTPSVPAAISHYLSKSFYNPPVTESSGDLLRTPRRTIPRRSTWTLCDLAHSARSVLFELTFSPLRLVMWAQTSQQWLSTVVRFNKRFDGKPLADVHTYLLHTSSNVRGLYERFGILQWRWKVNP